MSMRIPPAFVDYLEALPMQEEGRMYGFLRGTDQRGRLLEWWAYSGAEDPRLQHPHFVPPAFDVRKVLPDFGDGEEKVKVLTRAVDRLEASAELRQAKTELAELQAASNAALIALKVELRKRKLQRAEDRVNQGRSEDTLLRESKADSARLREAKQHWKAQIKEAAQQLEHLTAELSALRRERSQLSARLQEDWFKHFTVPNHRGEERSLHAIFNAQGLDLPPSGTGECAAPKLLAHAFRHGVQVVEFGEFWWGPPPREELRKQGRFYPPCRGRCQPLLRYMIEGNEDLLPSEPHPESRLSELTVLASTEDWLVVNKPSGLLSVPGKSQTDSVEARIRRDFPNASGPLVVHRLDQATSGLMLLALNKDAHKNLQAQFAERRVQKRYTAVLDGLLESESGMISLPLRVDPLDRPRQVVDHREGKEAVTRWQLVEVKDLRSRVHFWPETGRSHQLRVHAAHPEGLGRAIIGDPLYGQTEGTERLHLHAEELVFVDPRSGERMRFVLPADF